VLRQFFFVDWIERKARANLCLSRGLPGFLACDVTPRENRLLGFFPAPKLYGLPGNAK
jgi:hypothetical protein